MLEAPGMRELQHSAWSLISGRLSFEPGLGLGSSRENRPPIGFRGGASLEINGVAHIRVNVDRFEDCIAFYDEVMPYLGLEVVHRCEEFVYYVGGRTGYYVAKANEASAGERVGPTRCGLDHICFRARGREDVDELYGFLQGIGATMVRAPEEGPWAPGYYSLSFLDPEGIRLEVNYVPGRGVFAEGASFDPAPDHPVTGRPKSSSS